MLVLRSFVHYTEVVLISEGPLFSCSLYFKGAVLCTEVVFIPGGGNSAIPP